MNIMNLMNDDDFKEYKFNDKFVGLDKEVASLFGARTIGFHLEILNPQCFSSPYHYHEQEEELVIVLEGEATLRQNNKFKKIYKNDLIFFPTGPEFVHQIYNHTDKPFRYFVLSNKAQNDVCFYPDSNKKLDRLNRIVTQNEIEVDYWKDELDPSIYWPKDHL